MSVNEYTLEIIRRIFNDTLVGADKIKIELLFDDVPDENSVVIVESADYRFEITKRYEMETVKTFGPDREIKVAKFDVASFLKDPGVWRPDGSGRPPNWDEWDEEDEVTFRTLADALKWVLSVLCSLQVDETIFCMDLERSNE